MIIKLSPSIQRDIEELKKSDAKIAMLEKKIDEANENILRLEKKEMEIKNEIERID